MNTRNFIENWIAASNNFDVNSYLDFYLEDAILDDPSVGRKFYGHKGIKEYFDRYFIDYNTNTKLVDIIIGSSHTHLEVAFTGTFAEGSIRGTFDFTFKDGKIAVVKADLLH